MILRALWWRPTRAHPVRTAATVLGVAIGVASVVSTLLASRAAVSSLGQDVETVAGRAFLELTQAGGVRAEDLGALRPLSGEVVFAPVVEGTLLAPKLEDRVRLLGVDMLLGLGAASPNSGTGMAESLGVDGSGADEVRARMLLGNGVALSSSLAAELGVSVGDSFEVLARARPIELEVATVLEPTELASTWQRLVLCDIALAQEVLGRIGWYDRVEFHERATEGRPRTAAETDDIAQRAAALLPPTYTVAPASARREEGLRLVRALEFNLTALSGVSILVGIVLVATSLATSIVQRRKSIAVLRSLGAGRAQLASAVLTESAAIGLVGGGLGVLFGYYGAHAALGSVRTTMVTLAADSFSGGIEFEPAWIALGLALGVGTSLVAALLPLLEALRTPPVQALSSARDAQDTGSTAKRLSWLAGLLALALGLAALPAPEDRPVWALAAALVLLSTLLVGSTQLIDLVTHLRPGRLLRGAATPLRLAQASVGAARQRAAWAAGGVGVAVGLAVSMATMVGSFRATVVDWTSRTLRADLFVQAPRSGEGSATGRIDTEAVALARELFGADRIDEYHQTEARVEGKRIHLGGAPFEVVAEHSGLVFLDGRSARGAFEDALATGGVVVNEPFARRFDVSPGDEIRLETPGGVLPCLVTGVYRDYSGHLGRVVMDLERYLAIHGDEGAASFAVFLPPDEDPQLARARLIDALDDSFALDVLDQRQIRGEVLAIFERTFAVTIALQIVASFVAAIAVVAVLSALVQERKQELAIVRVLGGSRRQLAGMVLSEALLLGAAGAIGGLLVGLAVGYVLVARVNPQSFGWSLEFAPPWGSIAWTLAAVLPACLAAGLAPAWLVMKSSPHEALHEST